MLNLLRRFWKAQAVYCESDHGDTDSATLRRALRMFVVVYQERNEDFRRFYLSAEFRAEYESEAKRD